MKNHLIFILLILGATCGCMTNGSKLTEIRDQTVRLDILGVSMLPPQEGGWHYKKLTPGKIEFGKVVSKEKSFVALISLSRLPEFKSQEEFMKFLSDQRQRNTGNPRYETLINDEVFSEEKETPALRFHTKYKDKGSPHLPKGKEAFIVEDYGMFCRHPKAWGVSVNIVFSQRTLPGEERSDWEKVANEFIQNVEFVDFPKE